MCEGLQVKKITAQYFLLISSAKKIIKKNYFMLSKLTKICKSVVLDQFLWKDYTGTENGSCIMYNVGIVIERKNEAYNLSFPLAKSSA